MKTGVCSTTWCSLALICMVLMVAACTQQPSEPHSTNTPTPSSNTSDAYDFPIKPGTDAWRAFNSHVEMLNACQIPEPLLISGYHHELSATRRHYGI